MSQIEREWNMEKASRRTWAEHEYGQRATQWRENTLKEFWEIFVDDRPFGADAMFRQVNVESKAVFSYAMTMMDKNRGWEDEERWVRSKFAACMWIHTKEALTGGQILNQEQEKYLKKRMMSIMLCTNWVCAGAFVDHEWCRQGQLSNKRKKFLAWHWIFKIDVPCVVQWSLLWFSTPMDFESHLGT